MNTSHSSIQTPQSPLEAVTAQPRRGRVAVIVVGLLLTAWLMAGFYVVGADEAAVVRVCGRA